MTTTVLIGVLGAAILLGGFVLVEFTRITATSFTYNGINIIGSLLLTWYAVLLHSTPFIVLELAWALIATWYIVKHLAWKDKSS